MRRTTTGPGCDLRERHGPPGPRPCGSSRGSGCRAGRWPGRRAAATSFSSTSAEIACSQRSASLWTFSHSRPITSTSSRSARRWRRTIEVASSRPFGGEAQAAVVEQLGVAVVDEPVRPSPTPPAPTARGARRAGPGSARCPLPRSRGSLRGTPRSCRAIRPRWCSRCRCVHATRWSLRVLPGRWQCHGNLYVSARLLISSSVASCAATASRKPVAS